MNKGLIQWLVHEEVGGGGGGDCGLGKMVNVNVKYCHKNSYIYAIMLIMKDDHLTAGA